MIPALVVLGLLLVLGVAYALDGAHIWHRTFDPKCSRCWRDLTRGPHAW